MFHTGWDFFHADLFASLLYLWIYQFVEPFVDTNKTEGTSQRAISD